MQMMTVQAALTALVKKAVPGAQVIRTEEKEPVQRPSVKVDLLPMGCGMACAGMREREADLDIWYYPKDKEHPRNECVQVAEALNNALCDGFAVENTWIDLDDGMTAELTDGVLVCQCSMTWIESAAEEGEPMEELNYNETERS